MKKILITGANSYIGTSFASHMAQWPDEYQVDTIDLIDGSWREKSFAGYDSVFHVAGIAHISTKKLDAEQRKKYWSVNAELPVEVASKAKADGATQFVFLSSMSVYGEHGSMKQPIVITRATLPNPKDIYGESKLTAEQGLHELEDNDFKVCVLRPPMIYGPGCKGNYPLLEKAALKLPFFPYVENARSMLQIDLLCSYVSDMIDERCGGIHFPQNPEYVCTSKMVWEIAQQHGRRIKLTKALNPILKFLSGKVKAVDKVFGGLVYEQMGKCDVHTY